MQRIEKSHCFDSNKENSQIYGPAELILFPGSDDEKSPEGLLIGAAPLARPDLAKAASPVTYVDKNDPPFLIIHGKKMNWFPQNIRNY